MNHLQIAYFLAVAKFRSFSEAARQLFVAQSAISKQIQTLEKNLGIKLFVRSNRTINLTPAGEVLYRELEKYNNWLLQIIDMAKQVDQGKAGILNIGVMHGLDMSGSNIGFFIDFLEMYPGIQVNIQRIKLEDMAEALYMGTQDILVSYSFLANTMTDITSAVLSWEIDQLLVSRTHPLGKVKTVTPEALMEHTLVTISPEISEDAYRNSLNYLKGIGVSPQWITHTPTIEDIMLSVEFGLGYAIASDSSRLSRHKGSILFLDMYEGREAPVMEILVMWRNDSLNPSLQFFLEHAQNRLVIK